MKSAIKSEGVFILVCLAAFVLIALCAKGDDSQSEPVVLTTIYDDGQTNSWTQSDLTEALGLMNRKYHRDMESAEGRKSWHGDIYATVISTNESGVISGYDVHSDGYVHNRKARRSRTAIKDPEAKLKAAAKMNLPPQIAQILAARAAAASSATTNTVITVVTPAGN